MWALAMAPNMPGKVRPAGTSYSPSAADASTSVTPSVGSEVIFSTPPTSTTSYIPLAIAITPSRKAGTAAGAGVLHPRDRRRGHPQPIGHDRSRVSLVLEQVGGIVAQVAGFNVRLQRCRCRWSPGGPGKLRRTNRDWTCRDTRRTGKGRRLQWKPCRASRRGRVVVISVIAPSNAIALRLSYTKCPQQYQRPIEGYTGTPRKSCLGFVTRAGSTPPPALPRTTSPPPTASLLRMATPPSGSPAANPILPGPMAGQSPASRRKSTAPETPGCPYSSGRLGKARE